MQVLIVQVGHFSEISKLSQICSDDLNHQPFIHIALTFSHCFSRGLSILTGFHMIVALKQQLHPFHQF